MSYITALEEQKKAGADLLKLYKTEIDRPIAAILIINTIANTVGASVVGSCSAEYARDMGFQHDVVVGIVSAVFTLLILTCAEIIPKTIGSRYWRKLAIPAVRIIKVMIFLTFPIVLVLEKITSAIADKSEQTAVSREEVSAMVNVGEEEGVIEKEEKRMIQNLLKLDEITAHEIMTPSVVVTMADSSMTVKDLYDREEYNHYSRIPIYDDGNEDYITGYVLRQTILEYMSDDKFQTKLKDLARPVLFFPENKSVGDIWDTLLAKKEHISIIIDEYGAMRGIVTLEDVIETMLGFEIVDEKDEVVDMQEYAKAQWKQIQKTQHEA